MNHLSEEELAAALAVRDLTDPAQGPHALQLLVDCAVAAVAGPASTVVHRGDRIVAVADNYDRLGYHPAAAARDARYTRYVDGGRMLRSQTSALIPGALRGLAASGRRQALIVCPGIVHRRDAIDRLHTGVPHQLDLWLIAERPPPLLDLVAAVVGAVLPGVPWRTRAAVHPYTTDGLEIEARAGESWVEIGECGVVAGHVLAGAGLPTPAAGSPAAGVPSGGLPAGVRGLALGLGLDRLLMLRKGIDDIRLLRSTDPRVVRQMADLAPYRPVSAQPAATRDLSVALPAGVTAEDLGDLVREVLGADAHLVEEVAIRSVTPAAGLPAGARERLAIRDGEVNVLLRIVLRDLHGTLPRATVNALRDRIHAGLTHPRRSTAHGRSFLGSRLTTSS